MRKTLILGVFLIATIARLLLTAWQTAVITPSSSPSYSGDEEAPIRVRNG